MKVTIIETGLPPEQIRVDWPGYPTMFEALVSKADAGLSFETVSPVTGEALPDPESLDAILITGSAYGVYDPEPWMGQLMDFIRWAGEVRTPQVGVCFGHQAMAQALGGHVAKSDKGWGIGRHEYDVPHKPRWMDDAPDRLALAVSHQDQVLGLPPGAQVIAASDFTPYAALDYTHIPAMSFQGHPEFSAAFMSALYEVRRGTRLSHEAVDNANASLSHPVHNDEVGSWIARFFRQYKKDVAAS